MLRISPPMGFYSFRLGKLIIRVSTRHRRFLVFYRGKQLVLDY